MSQQLAHADPNVKCAIQDYYRNRATTDRYATSPDFNLREVEIEYLARHLRDGVRVLDAGCGNGYSTLCHAATFASDFVGIDFVPEMVEAARAMAPQFTLRGQVEFQAGDVTDLAFADASFDVVMSQRCLLNLPSREDQWRAMREIARVLRPGGRYLMLEGTRQGLERLNAVRTAFELAPIPEAAPGYNWFSNKFDEKEMRRVAEGLFRREVTVQRFGMYYFIARVVHPLMVAPAEPSYDAPINAVARQVCRRFPDFESLGHVALFVFEK